MVTFRRVSRQLQQGRVEWHNRAFTTTGLLRRFLTKEGWTITAPWQFVHNSGYGRFVERRINLRRFVDLSISQQGPTRSADAVASQPDQWVDPGWTAWSRGCLGGLLKRCTISLTWLTWSSRGTRPRSQVIIGQCSYVSAVVSDAWLHVSNANHDPLCSFFGEDHGHFPHLMFECTRPKWQLVAFQVWLDQIRPRKRRHWPFAEHGN